MFVGDADFDSADKKSVVVMLVPSMMKGGRVCRVSIFVYTAIKNLTSFIRAIQTIMFI